jgi:hypothetical protein
MRSQELGAERNRRRLQQGLNARNKTEYVTLTTVIPITGAAGGGTGDRVATSKAQLAGFALDGDRTNDRG